jgi:ethanolaminephosphotransferase
MSMFSKDLFLERSELTLSFFVTDYTSVDTNITRHLEAEFSEELAHSWDLLILHYLGFDHIGSSFVNGIMHSIWFQVTVLVGRIQSCT